MKNLKIDGFSATLNGIKMHVCFTLVPFVPIEEWENINIRYYAYQSPEELPTPMVLGYRM